MTPKLPLFTYGTLRPDNKNSIIYSLIEGSLDGYLEGYELKDTQSYPIALQNPEEIIWGAIVWLNLENYDQILSTLDAYEGQGFQRSLVEAKTCEDSTEVPCWVYHCQNDMITQVKKLPKVHGGYWQIQNKDKKV